MRVKDLSIKRPINWFIRKIKQLQLFPSDPNPHQSKHSHIHFKISDLSIGTDLPKSVSMLLYGSKSYRYIGRYIKGLTRRLQMTTLHIRPNFHQSRHSHIYFKILSISTELRKSVSMLLYGFKPYTMNATSTGS